MSTRALNDIVVHRLEEDSQTIDKIIIIIMFLRHLFGSHTSRRLYPYSVVAGEVACFTQGGPELGQTTGKDEIYNCAVAVLLKNHLTALSLALLCIKYIFKSFNECEVKINGMKNDGVAFAAAFSVFRQFDFQHCFSMQGRRARRTLLAHGVW